MYQIRLLLLFFAVFGSALEPPGSTHAQSSIKTLVLYDATSGNTPDASLMSFIDVPQNTAPVRYADGVTIFDSTMAGTHTYAGWISNSAMNAAFPTMDGSAGVQVNFTLQVESESHQNQNRSGLSIIMLDQDAKGIELSFWENEIWVKSDENTGGLFDHGEGIAFSTNSMTDYQVTFDESTYTLTANAEKILGGPLRDYSTFEGFPDPYETPNFIFLGDDTTSAQARVRVQFLSVTGTEPAVPNVPMTAAGNTPIPLSTSTAFPSAPPLSTPTPEPPGNGFQLCPSGWIIGVATIVVVSKKIKHRKMDQL